MIYDIQRRMSRHSISRNSIQPAQVYSVGEAARLLGLSPSGLRNLEQQGRLECTRTPGGQRRFLGADLLRLGEASASAPIRTTSEAQPRTAAAVADRSAHQAWLGGWISKIQRELPLDTPSEVRLRAGTQLEQALRQLGPDSDTRAVEQVVTSILQKARLAAEEARHRARRLENKTQLLEYAQSHLRRTVSALPKRIVGALGSPKRVHVKAMLRDQLHGRLQKRLTGDEAWSEVREWVDEFVAGWQVRQTPERRIPPAIDLLGASLAGAAGAAAAAALSKPEVRIRVKERLSALAAEFVKRFSPPSPPPAPDASSPPSSPPSAPTGPSLGSLVHPWPKNRRLPGAWRPLRRPLISKPPTDGPLKSPERSELPP